MPERMERGFQRAETDCRFAELAKALRMQEEPESEEISSDSGCFLNFKFKKGGRPWRRCGS